MIDSAVVAQAVVIVAGVVVTFIAAISATLAVRGRWPGRRSVTAMFVIVVVAWIPLPDHWNDGCNRHYGWVPLLMIAVASPLERAGVSPSATDSQTMMRCGQARVG